MKIGIVVFDCNHVVQDSGHCWVTMWTIKLSVPPTARNFLSSWVALWLLRTLIFYGVRCVFVEVIKRLCIVAKIANYLRHVSPSVCPCGRIYRRGSLWTGFDEIWHWRLEWKTVEKTRIWLKSIKMSGCLHEDISTICWWRRH